MILQLEVKSIVDTECCGSVEDWSKSPAIIHFILGREKTLSGVLLILFVWLFTPLGSFPLEPNNGTKGWHIRSPRLESGSPWRIQVWVRYALHFSRSHYRICLCPHTCHIFPSIRRTQYMKSIQHNTCFVPFPVPPPLLLQLLLHILPDQEWRKSSLQTDWGCKTA